MMTPVADQCPRHPSFRLTWHAYVALFLALLARQSRVVAHDWSEMLEPMTCDVWVMLPFASTTMLTLHSF